MKQIVVILITLLIGVKGIANEAIPYNKWWSQANRFYQQKSFDSAVVYYEKIAEYQPANEVLYYNLGNAYYRLNKIGFAILNYNKALRLKPDYKQASDNLALAQNRIKGRLPELQEVFFIRWWNQLSLPAYASSWAILSLVVFLLLLGVIFWNKHKRQVVIHQGIMYALVGIFLCVLSLAYVSAQQNENPEKAIVVIDAAVFKMKVSGKLESVPEGTLVTIERNENDKVEVSLPDGRIGIIDTTAIKII